MPEQVPLHGVWSHLLYNKASAIKIQYLMWSLYLAYSVSCCCMYVALFCLTGERKDVGGKNGMPQTLVLNSILGSPL